MIHIGPDHDFVLTPYRSLGRRGFLVVMGLLVGASLVAGLGFALHGAWPVLGFLGLDVLLVWLALRQNVRSGSAQERVIIDDGKLIIMRRAAGGRQSVWRFPAYWARADIEDAVGRHPKLYVGSHNRRVRIGAFLPPTELRALRAALQDALRLSRTAFATGRV